MGRRFRGDQRRGRRSLAGATSVLNVETAPEIDSPGRFRVYCTLLDGQRFRRSLGSRYRDSRVYMCPTSDTLRSVARDTETVSQPSFAPILIGKLCIA
jgi:hypothetical protein